MSLRFRPRGAIKTAWQRSRRRWALVVLQSCASCACAAAVSLIRRTVSTPSWEKLHQRVSQKRGKGIRCIYWEGSITIACASALDPRGSALYKLNHEDDHRENEQEMNEAP
jgi:hypothetical protein